MPKEYKAAAYLRLSKDDGDKDESNSIQSQRKIISEFIKSRDDIEIINERIDDGFSGVSFERPAFKALIDDIKNRNINCVIVKDLSRLGRNYIESGYYIERFFPSEGIRFIAVTDCIDSLKKGFGDSLLIPFKNLLNDSYSADISSKIRASLDIKRKNGEFIGAFAPYGYKKDSKNKNCLVKDEYSSFIVMNIFLMAFLGISCGRIAERLNNSGVLPPEKYCRNKEVKNAKPVYNWSTSEVKNILTNEVYTGCLVQGKKSTPNHKIKKYTLKPENMWFKASNTHEAVINKSIFNTVNRTLKISARTSSDSLFIYQLSGILYCGKCKMKMVHHTINSNGFKYMYYMCSGYKKGLCKNSAVESKSIEYTVSNVINMYALLYLGTQKVYKINSKLKDLSCILNTEHEIDFFEKRVDEINRIISYIDTDRKKGILSKEDEKELKDFYLKEKKTLISRIEGLLNNKPEEDLCNQRTATLELIKNIFVCSSNLIEIELKFSLQAGGLYV